jgi:hypothetical protein
LIDVRLVEDGETVRISVTSAAKSPMGSNNHKKHLAAINKGIISNLGSKSVVSAALISQGATSAMKIEGEVLRAIGTNGAIVLCDSKLVIHRAKNLSTAILHGMKGDKEIRLPSISSVQLRKPGAFTAGYMQLELRGGQTSQRGIWDATSDENTVLFTAGQLDGFLLLKASVDAALDRLEKPSAQPVPIVSAAEQLKQWKDLLDSGAIT